MSSLASSHCQQPVVHEGNPLAEQKTRWAVLLTLIMMVAEIGGGWFYNSMALLARVRRIKGQTGALESALEQETDCAAILQQIAAIRGAVNGLMLEVLEGHMREHLGAAEATPAERLEDLDQVVRVLRSYLK